MIRFRPWVGEGYDAASPKLMILGESHHAFQDEINSDLTADTVTSYIGAEHHCPWHDYFTKVHRVVLGREVPIDRESRRKFWANVIFYNYVQEIAA